MYWGSSQSAEGTESRSEIQGTEEGGWRGSWGPPHNHRPCLILGEASSSSIRGTAECQQPAGLFRAGVCWGHTGLALGLVAGPV